MKQINEHLSSIQSLSDFLAVRTDESLASNLLAKFKRLYDKVVSAFGRIWTKLKGSCYWIAMDKNGDIYQSITPGTASQAYKDGEVDRSKTVVVASNETKRVTGNNAKPDDAKKLYGSGNSIKYWDSMLKESEDTNAWEYIANYLQGFEPINEVKMHTDDPEARYNVVDSDELRDEILMALKHPEDAPLLIFGAPGIGKTAILRTVLDSYPEMKGAELICKTLSNETPDNFTLPKYVTVDGQEKADDVPKTWLPVYKPTGDKEKDAQADAACGRGLLFIDELSRATPQVLNVVLPLINEKIFNGYKVGSGWVIIAASNRPEDELSGQTSLGNALLNRFNVLYYEPTAKSWMEWAKAQNYISPLLLSWLAMPESENMSGGKYFYWDPNESGENDNPASVMCTPRSWTNAMRKLARYAETGTLEGFTIFDIPRRIIGRALNGVIPATAVDGFLAFLETVSRIGNFDAAVEGVWNRGVMPKIKPQDLQKVALPFAQLIVSAHANSLPTGEEFENWAKAMVAADSEQLASYALDIIQNVMFGAHGLKKSYWSKMFYINTNRKEQEKQEPETYKSIWIPTFEKFAGAWGITLDELLKNHDWEKGFDLLVEKYGDAFENFTIAGKTVLA